MSGGAGARLSARIGRMYLAACAAVLLIASISFFAIQHYRALSEAEAAGANLARVACDEIFRNGIEAGVSYFQDGGLDDCTLRVSADDGTVLASVGERRADDVTAGLWGKTQEGLPLYVEVGYRRPPVITSDGALLVAAAVAAAMAFAFLTRKPLVRRAIEPAEIALAHQRDFVAAASHELKSPLSVVALDLEAISAASNDADRVLQLSEEGLRECKRLSDLIEDLLALAAGDAEGWRLERSRCDAVDILIDAYEQMEGKAESLGIEIKLKLPPESDAFPVEADSSRVSQALRALLENALDYSPQNGSVELALSAEQGSAVFQVSDKGPGVPDDLKARVFDRFYRASAARDSRTHHGLGLSVAKEIAEAHGGLIRILDNPGGGATFALSIPLSK